MKNPEQEQKKVKIKKRDTYESIYALYEGQELTLHAFRSGIFPIKSSQTVKPKQMLQRLPIAFTHK